MRKQCPVCGSTKRVDVWNMNYLVPDGWELPKHNNICLCDCGMIYYDNDKTQADYDLYYKNRYGSDGTLTNDINSARLEELIDLICETEKNKSACIVDFGGGEGYIENRLKSIGYTDVHTSNVGDELPINIDLLIASHVLEHVYDLKDVMNRLTKHVTGKFLVDLPDAIGMAKITNLPILDYHQKHINHFSARALNNLFNQYGYVPIYALHYLIKSHNYPAYRVVYDKINEFNAYYTSWELIQAGIKTRIEQMRKISCPVVVWGCGDICLFLLANVHLNIIHYVDNDPAFIGQTIGGVPVLDHTDSDAPIVVIAQAQQTTIIERIKRERPNNEIIVI